MRKRKDLDHELELSSGSNFARNVMAYHDWADRWQLHNMGQPQDRDLFHVEHHRSWWRRLFA